MRWPNCAAALCALLTLSACVIKNVEHSKAAVKGGFRCNLEDNGPFGKLRASIEIADADPRPVGYLGWDWGEVALDNPWFSGAWFFRDGLLSIENGYVIFTHRLSPVSKKPDKRTVTLELRAGPNPSIFAEAKIIGKPGPAASGPSLQADATDVIAMARGTSQLYLIARDKKGRIIDRSAVNSKVFVDVQPHLASAIERVNQMIANPATACAREENLRSDDIIIT